VHSAGPSTRLGHAECAAQPGQTYTRSANVWAGTTYDPSSNTVYLPMGSPSVDLYGATRSAADLKYGASILALDAATGKEKWVYQTVHNDLWDFDLPMAPTLIDFPTRRCHHARAGRRHQGRSDLCAGPPPASR
jgi:glucose dehydrogenase